MFHEFTLVRQIWFAIIDMFSEFVEIITPKVFVFLSKSEDRNTIKPHKMLLFRYQYDIHSQSWELVKILASNPDTFKDILVGKEKRVSFGVFIFFFSLLLRFF
jgi:hypothetical protein